jgi:hypothetical protein
MGSMPGKAVESPQRGAWADSTRLSTVLESSSGWMDGWMDGIRDPDQVLFSFITVIKYIVRQVMYCNSVVMVPAYLMPAQV